MQDAWVIDPQDRPEFFEAYLHLDEMLANIDQTTGLPKPITTAEPASAKSKQAMQHRFNDEYIPLEEIQRYSMGSIDGL